MPGCPTDLLTLGATWASSNSKVEAHLGDVDFANGHLFVLDYAHGGLSWLEKRLNSAILH